MSDYQVTLHAEPWDGRVLPAGERRQDCALLTGDVLCWETARDGGLILMKVRGGRIISAEAL